MPQAREIKRRIKSVQNTKQITRAMKMIAAAKLQRAQGRMLAMRPYANRLIGIIDHVAFELFGDEHPLFFVRPERRVATIVIAGDRGLCGGFNTGIVRRALGHLASLPQADHRLWCIGRRATSSLRKEPGLEIVRSYQGVFDSLSYSLAGEICDQLVEEYLGNVIDAAYVVYNEFVTVVSPKPRVEKVLPIDFGEILAARTGREQAAAESAPQAASPRALWELEPLPGTVLERLVARLVATRVYRATLESYAAELGARMSAMDSATKNADEMITRLTMVFNRARQAGITAELLDIVGGAEGLSG